MSEHLKAGALPALNELRAQFSLRADVCYLNHGACGACPRSVMEEWQRWQWLMEEEPAEFLFHDSDEFLPEARRVLAERLGARQQDLVFFENVTTALNAVIRSLNLQAGDEILTTDHEYGALIKAWDYVCARTGARLVKAPLDLPLASPNEVCNQVMAHASERTRVLFVSHISSPTAICMPVAELISRARIAGILSLIDGAHSPGQVELNLDALGADFYGGNCHKWLMAPPGAAFLHVKEEHQAMMQPLVVSWGWGNADIRETRFLDEQQYRGTKDISHWLAVPAAWEFRDKWNWSGVSRQRVEWLRDYDEDFLKLLRCKSMYHEDWDPFLQMRIYETPWTLQQAPALQRALREQYRITVPLTEWRGRIFVRPSLQGYNGRQDLETLLLALEKLL